MPGPPPCPPPGPNHGVPRLAGLLRLVYESARGFPFAPSECDDVSRSGHVSRSGEQQNTTPVSTREVTNGLRRTQTLVAGWGEAIDQSSRADSW